MVVKKIGSFFIFIGKLLIYFICMYICVWVYTMYPDKRLTIIMIVLMVLLFYSFFHTYTLPGRMVTVKQPNADKPRESVRPKVQYFRRIKTFERSVRSAKSKLAMGSIALAPMPDDRVHGGVALINNTILKDRKTEKKWYRNHYKRSNAYVPGFDGIQETYVYGGERYHLWHRTHVIPLDISLSEGDDMDGLLFPGTAHINSGDRPQKNYFVRKQGNARVNALFERWKEHQQLYLFKESHIAIPNTPKGTHYSMSDIEWLSSRIVMYCKTVPFKYAVECVYNKGNHTQVPDKVHMKLYNLETNTLVLHVVLPNTK